MHFHLNHTSSKYLMDTFSTKQMNTQQKADESHPGRAPLSERLSNRRKRCITKKRVGEDDERLRRNRRTIDNYLRRMGSVMGKELTLNAEGVTYFSFRRFVIVIEVPEDNSGVCFFYTMVCRLEAESNQMQVMKLAMELNYMQYGTRGATLGLNGDEVNLCFSIPIAGLHFCDFETVLEDFTTTAVEMNGILDAAKTAPLGSDTRGTEN